MGANRRAAPGLFTMLTTACTYCHTAFQISPPQLKAREGRVRCGKCNAIFNALSSLTVVEDRGETEEYAQKPFEHPAAQTDTSAKLTHDPTSPAASPSGPARQRSNLVSTFAQISQNPLDSSAPTGASTPGVALEAPKLSWSEIDSFNV